MSMIYNSKRQYNKLLGTEYMGSEREVANYLIDSFRKDTPLQFSRNLDTYINTRLNDSLYSDVLSEVCRAILRPEIEKYSFTEFNIGELKPEPVEWNKEKFKLLAKKSLALSYARHSLGVEYCLFLTLVITFIHDDQQALDQYLDELSKKDCSDEMIQHVASGYYKSEFRYKELLDLMGRIILHKNYDMDFATILGNSTVVAVIKKMDKTSVLYKGLVYKIKSLGLKGSYGI